VHLQISKIGKRKNQSSNGCGFKFLNLDEDYYMNKKQHSFSENDITVQRLPLNYSQYSSITPSMDDADGNDGDPGGTTDSYAGGASLSSNYLVINGEGHDGDTDGSESDGDDNRF
jgi:hypothetical protein